MPTNIPWIKPWKLFQPIALVLCSNEQIELVSEFLKKLKEQSPNWEPASVMTDNCGSEIASFHEVFHPERDENGRGISSLKNMLFWTFAPLNNLLFVMYSCTSLTQRWLFSVIYRGIKQVLCLWHIARV